MHLSWAELLSKFTVVPDHDFVSGVARGFAPSNNGEYVGFMDHLYNPDSGSKLPWELLTDLVAEFENFESFLGSDWEVGLVLVEGNVQNLLLIFLHDRPINISAELKMKINSGN
jgi:hypothetical protein